MEKYEKPGERLVSKVPNDAYKDNYDKIFGKKESWLDRREREKGEARGGAISGLCTGTQEDHRHQGYYQDCLEQQAEMQEKKKHDNCTD